MILTNSTRLTTHVCKARMAKSVTRPNIFLGAGGTMDATKDHADIYSQLQGYEAHGTLDAAKMVIRRLKNGYSEG